MTRHPTADDGSDVVVAGLGSAYRHDDAVGAVVSERAAHLRGVHDAGPIGNPLGLLGRWDGAALAIVVDAVQSGARPGTIRVMDLTGPGGGASHAADPYPRFPTVPRSPDSAHATSSHGVDVLGVLRLAQVLGRAPVRVVLVGVEGEDFSPGFGLSPQVAAAVPEAIGEVARLVQEFQELQEVQEVRPCA